MSRIDLLKAQQEARKKQTPVQGGNDAHIAIARQQAQEMAATPPTVPVLQTVDPEEVRKSTREQYIQSLDYNTAMQKGDISEKDWAYGQIKKMEAEGKNPGEFINTLAWLGSAETPDEKRKRERRDALGEAFQGLGNLIGSAANLYYAQRGGQYIDLNSIQEKQRERMQRLKDKQDALDEKRKEILMRARMGDVKTKRDAELKAEERIWKIKHDSLMKEIDHAYKIGQIDAQTRNRLIEQAAKTKDEKELEAIKQQNRIALKTTPTFGESKVITSLTGSDGGTWTRNTNLSEEEIRELSEYVEDWTPYTYVDENGKESIDYIGALADAAESGKIPAYILEEKGFKRSKDSSRRKDNDIVAPHRKGSKNTPPTKR